MALLLLCCSPALGQPYYPHYPTRSVASLDGDDWLFAFSPAFGDVLRDINTSSIPTTEKVSVPSTFDNARPGVLGRRGTAFYRRTMSLPAGRHGLLQFGACSFYCRVFIDGVLVGSNNFTGGYTPFWVDVPADASRSTREVFVLADNRWNATTAPVHTGGDFYCYGGLTRSVQLHTLPAADGAFIAFVGVLPLNTTHVNVSVRLRAGAAAGGDERRAECRRAC